MIKLFVMDVDGTLTDGKIYIGSNGELMKAFNVKDGLGITKLIKANIIPVILTGRKSEIVLERAKELNITQVYQQISDKPTKLKEIAKNHNCDISQIAYIGDDENDIESMNICGLKACPSDAIESVKMVSDFICSKEGGNGAVREFIEFILKKQSI